MLVRPKDGDALAAALLEVARDEELRRTMGEKGSEQAQHYSWERISQRVLSYYERLAYEKSGYIRPQTDRIDPGATEKVEA
jgi:glycosyltransferase involved in cell wall biosynthesis